MARGIPIINAKIEMPKMSKVPKIKDLNHSKYAGKPGGLETERLTY